MFITYVSMYIYIYIYKHRYTQVYRKDELCCCSGKKERERRVLGERKGGKQDFYCTKRPRFFMVPQLAFTCADLISTDAGT